MLCEGWVYGENVFQPFLLVLVWIFSYSLMHKSLLEGNTSVCSCRFSNPMDGREFRNLYTAISTRICLFNFITQISNKANGTPLQYSCLENSWTEEPGRLQSMGSLRVRNDWATSLSLFTFMHWRRKWQPTPVFLLGESQGRGRLVGCCLWGRTELDTTEAI